LAAEIRVRRVRNADIDAVAGTMRVADQAEALLYGLSPSEGLRRSIAASTESWTVDVDGVPAGVFGLGRSAGNTGAPWLLATEALPQAWMGVSRRAVGIVRKWSRSQTLTNYCDANNATAIRFLMWLGFTVEAPRKGRVLLRFTMPRHGDI